MRNSGPFSISNRTSLLSLIGKQNDTSKPSIKSHACISCILATVGAVCDEACVQEELHIIPNPSIVAIPATSCLPDLRNRLATDQFARLGTALQQKQPFGLSLRTSLITESSFDPTDLYVPTKLSKKVTLPIAAADDLLYIGVDTKYYAFECKLAGQPRRWAFTDITTAQSNAVAELETAVQNCVGSLYLDVGVRGVNGKARFLVGCTRSASVANCLTSS